jgi:hypothetical protein
MERNKGKKVRFFSQKDWDHKKKEHRIPQEGESNCRPNASTAAVMINFEFKKRR